VSATRTGPSTGRSTARTTACAPAARRTQCAGKPGAAAAQRGGQPQQGNNTQRRTPGTNGVVERFFRTQKEQVVHGHVFETIEDVREAVRDFIARYNAEWLVEKTGYLSPHALRRQHELAAMPMAA